ncbi:hypothetical protein [Parabacteroides sp. PF5-6]|uniref:hypothetical protein n=1 Tax=Parabacteroides sp. PF5-6 TaxID=1742403 RepID=UPI0024069DE6|nr:hypothetical protein [Parabacteroides sp. PF5-6]MDF9829633.1 hypothetical protein [Parabacteroides sp. PF5-6]
MMENKDYMGRTLVVLVWTMIGCFALYGLPDELWGHKIKRVDLFSDIRLNPNTRKAALDSIKQVLSLPDTLQIDTVALRTSVVEATGMDTTSLQQRDSLYNRRYAATATDSAASRIQDFSPGHIGLKRFFRAINDRHKMDRPVRIAFMGDSFIEGDIMVSDFRSLMQKQFGGRGVGFVPVTSVTAQFRPTVNQAASGWKTWSMIHDQSHDYVLPGMLFEAEKEQATIQMKNTNRHPELPEVETVQLYYMANRNTRMQLVLNQSTDTISRQLAPTDRITRNISEGQITEASYTFTQVEGFQALGVALEDRSGMVVDNFSLRGNSGMILERFDRQRCRQWSEVRPYDLIVLQYGLNVISEDMLDYGWYRARMIEVVRHLRECFPDTDILLLSVTDRSHLEDGVYQTMPEVLAMLHTQQQIARRAGIPFWNMFAAMGGENSMVRYVENNWASKDYTHFSFRGGRELANALMKALLTEKEFYDEAEKTLR